MNVDAEAAIDADSAEGVWQPAGCNKVNDKNQKRKLAKLQMLPGSLDRAKPRFAEVSVSHVVFLRG